jgi:hypothetical protein
MAIDITRFWEIRGYVQEGLTWFERLLAQADEIIPMVVHAHAFTFAAFLAHFLDYASITASYGREAVALAEAAGDEGKPIHGLALGALAASAQEAGDYHTAFTIATRCVQLLRASSWPPFYLGMSLSGDISD